MPLGEKRWGKSDVRVSKVLRTGGADDFIDVAVQVMLRGDVGAAYVEGDNSGVVPTDTMRNSVYALAQEYLTRDLERFAEVLCVHFLDKESVNEVAVSIDEYIWSRRTVSGFVGGGSERRTALVTRGTGESTSAGLSGLVVLKTTGSAFEGFPKDDLTTLPEASDRILATSITAEWDYPDMPENTTATWGRVRQTIVDHFFSDWSASVQHQGYLMGEAVLEVVPEISEIRFRLPNQHHLPFDLTRFGMDWKGTVYHPVTEPYGDIHLTVTR